MPMFKGRDEAWLVKDFEAKGWPSAAAKEIAAYLVGEQMSVPEYRPDYWERRKKLREKDMGIE